MGMLGLFFFFFFCRAGGTVRVGLVEDVSTGRRGDERLGGKAAKEGRCRDASRAQE